MRLDKLTLKTQEALEDAQKIMSEHSHQQMESEHLLLGLLRQDEGLVRQILAAGSAFSQDVEDLSKPI